LEEQQDLVEGSKKQKK